MSRLWNPDIADRPDRFVIAAYPWGMEGTALAQHDGPRRWQLESLRDIGEHIKAQRLNIVNHRPLEMFQEATASGRGIGKSARFAWLAHWMASTRLGSTVVVTANNEAQLKGATWGEMGKWFTLAVNSHWFELAALSVRPAAWFKELVEQDLKIGTAYYYAEAKLWKEETPDAFAGIHNPHGVLLIFDESSGIPSPIWTVSEGFFTEPVVDRYWIAASNPRRNSGAFFECFHRNRNYWRTRQIDSRTVEGTDPAQYEKIIKQHGADSDEARIEVYGEFPRTGDKQFIGRQVAEDAQEREVAFDAGAPLVMGVDVSRFGDDTSVIAFRRGRDARSLEWLSFKGLDTVQLAARVAELADRHRDILRCINVDGAGVGGGVVDMLKARGYRTNDVQSGARADDGLKYANKRAEMWDRMREWLTIGAIPKIDTLYDDLVGPDYRYDAQNRILLERKDEMKKRGLASPDFADALAMTFAENVGRLDHPLANRVPGGQVAIAKDVDYPVFGNA